MPTVLVLFVTCVCLGLLGQMNWLLEQSPPLSTIISLLFFSILMCHYTFVGVLHYYVIIIIIIPVIITLRAVAAELPLTNSYSSPRPLLRSLQPTLRVPDCGLEVLLAAFTGRVSRSQCPCHHLPEVGGHVRNCVYAPGSKKGEIDNTRTDWNLLQRYIAHMYMRSLGLVDTKEMIIQHSILQRSNLIKSLKSSLVHWSCSPSASLESSLSTAASLCSRFLALPHPPFRTLSMLELSDSVPSARTREKATPLDPAPFLGLPLPLGRSWPSELLCTSVSASSSSDLPSVTCPPLLDPPRELLCSFLCVILTDFLVAVCFTVTTSSWVWLALL